MKNQKGMTLISWVIVLTFVGFQFMLAIKIVPVFAEDHTIRSVWAGLSKTPELAGISPKRIRASVLKRLKINNVYSLGREDIKIKKSRGYYIVSVEYEPRVNLFGKLDFITTFKHENLIAQRR